MISLKRSSEKTNNTRLMTIFLVTLAGFLFAVIYCYVMGHVLGKGYPYDSILFIPSDRFMDYYNTIVHAFDTYSSVGAGAGYFPFMYITLVPFQLFSQYTSQFTSYLVYFLIFGVIYFVSAISTLAYKSKIQNYAIAVILFAISFPFIFLVDRGNVEAFVYLFVLMFIYFYRKKKFTTASVFLAMAISCKAFPVMFAIIYLRDKKYKEFFKVAAFSIILSVGSFFILGSKLNEFIANLNFFTKNYFVEDRGIPFSHNLHSFFKIMLAVFKKYNILTEGQIANMLNVEISIYVYVVMFFVAIIAIYVIVFERVGWRIVALLTISMLLFANVSFDYRMIYLMIPIMLFIISNEKLTLKANIFYSLLFGLMLIPKKDYFITDYLPSISNIVGGIINPLLFMIVIIAIMHDGLKGKKIGAEINVYMTRLFNKRVSGISKVSKVSKVSTVPDKTAGKKAPVKKGDK
jgi:hypothetical protein